MPRERPLSGGEALVEAVDAVLDALEALGDRAHAAREALEVGRRGDVERADRDLLRLGGLLARLERAGDRAVDERVLEQVLGELAEGVLALPGEALAQAVAAVSSSAMARTLPRASDPNGGTSHPRLEG